MGFFERFMAGKKAEMAKQSAEQETTTIDSRPKLETKVNLLQARFEQSAAEVDRLEAMDNVDPEALKDAIAIANRDGHNFVLADTYLKLADCCNEVREADENGPDIRAVANPAGYEVLAM